MQIDNLAVRPGILFFDNWNIYMGQLAEAGMVKLITNAGVPVNVKGSEVVLDVKYIVISSIYSPMEYLDHVFPKEPRNNRINREEYQK